jgi:hypothetical protein
VAPTTDPGLTFTAIYAASGLNASQRMILEADGFRTAGGVDALFRSLIGPDPTGIISAPATAATSPSKYSKVVFRAYPVGMPRPDCNEAEQNRVRSVACALVAVRETTAPSPVPESPPPE